MLPLAEARNNHLKTDWDNLQIPVPWFLGRRLVEPRLEELIPFINWTFFPAPELREGALEILDRLVRGKQLRARGVYGFWPASSIGDDIVVYKDDARAAELVRFHMLRQQQPSPDGQPNRSLADFVATKESFAPDYIGAFAVTAGIGLDEIVLEYETQQDVRSAMVAKALADRLAEAFAEHLHAQARQDWGYAADERLSNEELIEEKYRGIRPAFGNSACPDHSDKPALFRLLHAAEVGITLTESFAMMPASSVSGIYLAHPEAKYFNVGRIGRDQVEDYAARKGVSVEQAERWLASNLGY